MRGVRQRAGRDVARTVAAAPQLCLPGATLLWTRHRRAPDLTPSVRGWFADAGFEELAWVAPDDVEFGVGAQRYAGGPVPLENIGGRAEFITFSLDGSTIWYNPLSWFQAFRPDRAGTSLRSR